ncbi:TetR/AcrR family transcriptional regulator [Prescottella agglutinans]|uniref:AcrR family transcriptional regulator n=1 Tax=Prescottella agglutinans TaxID=1644129 RepID=A0ABT6MHX6_9NOCA|nr:TetR/AcrR family transcriptional regulator [Prescottella agglutinans]MDH6283923.1 AcrR family transcriptional regulator [Prescottella agglutinans]
MYRLVVVRVKDPAVRELLVERAARMLRAREPITTRSLVAGTGVSTMAVYTYFAGMDGLWMAVRQEGFTRLAAILKKTPVSDDPIRDLVALGSAYVSNALANPDLYRVMFDDTIELADPLAADETLSYLVRAVERAKLAGRLSDAVVAPELATQCWIIGHGLTSLVATGPLARDVLDYGATMLTALLIRAGDEPAQCERSVAGGWGAYPLGDSEV